ncbi:MAG: DUF692 domain-containing protein [Gammaproteobacteria bacterium]|nr:DUF692 domain-containing protein [Gammaproteobacteria bacterium]MBT8133260.1 DUF692 domain-containing protein [Gammaproteobacteria bacterium]NNJ49615.1 DUF692 domain-containing protein [Gammaproteobacteria bacterium]
MNEQQYPVSGAGLGLRREKLDEMLDIMHSGELSAVDFMEVAPENWINVGGTFGKKFRQFTEKYDFVCHGLSLSIGSPAPLDEDFVRDVGEFLSTHGIKHYSEHLTYCSDDGHLYDLLPIPFTEEAVHYVAERIRRAQDILQQQISMENASYYTPAPGKEMEEIEFLNAVLDEADCGLLLDVNNIYVNAVNHNYDPVEFLKQLPAERIRYAHIAGHYNEADDLIVDTHGADVIDPVWHILDKAYEHFGVFPTLLERDFNIPAMSELLKEVRQIADTQKRWQGSPAERVKVKA